MTKTRLEGIVSPILTPFESDFSISMPLYSEHAAWSLQAGAHYISPFGTTGEAASVGLAERMQAIETLVESGLDPAKMMPGTGLNALPDTVDLTRHAVDLHCAAVMVLPPFYYPHSEDGLYAHYARLIEAVRSDRLKICLYHIPQMTGVPISPALTRRLSRTFPDIVVAYKDSSGDWVNAKAVIDAAPSVAVFPASENQLELGLAQGAAGSISATVNSQPRTVRRAFDALKSGDRDGYAQLSAAMTTHRMAVQSAGFIPALKSMMAAATGDSRWLNVRAPMADVDPDLGQTLMATLNWSLQDRERAPR